MNTVQLSASDMAIDNDVTISNVGNQSSIDMVTFVDNQDATMSSINNELTAIKLGLQPSLMNTDPALHDFLKRPKCIVQYSVAVGAPSLTPVATVSVDSYLTSAAISNKLMGVTAINFTAVARMTINADPFLQGRYMMIFVPSGTACPSWTVRNASFITLTQFPRAEIDLSTQNTAMLRIPFIYFKPYLDLKTAASGNPVPYGSFFIYQYGAVATGTGSTNCEMSVYLNLEDIELALPGPQSASGRKSVKGVKLKMLNPELKPDQEVKPVSGFFDGLSYASRALGKVPLLSSVSTTAAWVFENSSNAAKSFGFSNPETAMDFKSVQKGISAGMTNSDGPVLTNKMALTRGNNVVTNGHLKGNDDDELAIDSIISRPAFVGNISWTTTTAIGTVLANPQISPNTFKQNISVGGTTAIFESPLTFVSNFFGFWRGSITIKTKIVKTKYHSGRLQLGFVPNGSGYSAGVVPTNDNELFTLRRIIDIQDVTEFEITIPFLTSYPYLATVDSIGTLNYTVLNTLTCPDTVSSTISLISEVCAGPDFEFAGPAPAQLVPTAPLVIATPQMNCPPIMEKDPSDPDPECVMGSSDLAVPSLVPSQLCMGERILSMRSILKRFHPIITQAATVSNTSFGNHLVLNPHVIWVNDFVSSVESKGYYDLFSLLSSCYLLRRGSVMVKVVRNTATSSTSTPTSSFIHSAYNFYPSRINSVLSNTTSGANFSMLYNSLGPNHLERADNNNGATFTYPYYACTPWLVQDQYIYGTTPIQTSSREFGPMMAIVTVNEGVATTSADYPNYFRAAGDDYELGCFLTTPPRLN